MPSLFTELRRRNVFKVGAAYAIVAWLLIEVSSVLLPTFNAPEWIMQVFTLFVILGLPITLLMAWAYEITPEGIKAAADVRPSDSITAATGQRLNYVILGLVVLAVGFLVTDQYVLDQGIGASVVGTSRTIVTTPGPATSAPSSGTQRWTISLDETATLGGTGLVAELDVSPDGSRIAYATGGTQAGYLYIRALDQFEPVLMPGTQGARRPFFSDDSEWVAFGGMAVGQAKISIRGGPPQLLNQEGGRRYGGSWFENEIVFSQAPVDDASGGALYRLSANGGERELLVSPDAETAYIWPEFLPGGEAVLFTIRERDGAARDGSIAVLSLDTLEYQTLIEGGFNAKYAPTGHIVFARAGALWAVPFDLEQLETTGAATPMVEGVLMDGTLGGVPYGFSDGGLLVYVRGGDTGAGAGFQTPGRNLVWVTRDGLEQPLATEQRAYFYPRLSPDGQRLAVSINDGVNTDVYILDLVRGTSSRITSDPANDQRPVWTLDSQYVVYRSAREEEGIFRRATNGTGQAERLTTSPVAQIPEAFSPDGTLVFRTFDQGDSDLHILSMDGEFTSQPLLQTEFIERSSALSPDGRWIAYVSDETGRNEVYVRPFPNIDDDKIPISSDGGDEPLWGPDGRELFFLHQVDDDAEILMVSVTAEPNFFAGTPEVLFTGEYLFGGARPNWDISPDGQRFLLMKQPVVQTSIAFVNNWFEELNRLAPPSP